MRVRGRDDMGTGGPTAEPVRAAESEEWARMVDEGPAFYIEEGTPLPEKRGV